MPGTSTILTSGTIGQSETGQGPFEGTGQRSEVEEHKVCPVEEHREPVGRGIGSGHGHLQGQQRDLVVISDEHIPEGIPGAG